MNKLKLFFAITSFLLSYSIMAQEKVNPEIQKKVDSFMELSNQKKWEQAFDLMYPKLFTQVPKQDLIDVMTGMEQDGLSLQRNNIKLVKSSAPFQEGPETFVRIEYAADLIVQISAGSLYDDPLAIQGMTGQFQTSYGKENVVWNTENKNFKIMANISMMAIQTGHQWYLIEINNDQKELMEYLFPDSVMNALVRM